MRRLVFALLTLSVAATASAQPDWRAPGPGVSLDVIKYLETDGGFITDNQGRYLGRATIGTLQSLQILSARIPVGGGVRVVAEVPLAYADADYARLVEGLGDDFEGVGLGNPYLGVEVRRGYSRVGLGVRAPLATSRANFVGYLADAERPQATIQDHASATLSLDAARPVFRGIRVRLRVAPTVLVYTGEPVQIDFGPDPQFVDPDPWLAVAYGAMVEGEAGPASLSGGLVGYEETRAGQGFGFVSARAGVTVDAGPVRPGVSFRTRLGDTGPPEPIVGLSLDVPLR